MPPKDTQCPQTLHNSAGMSVNASQLMERALLTIVSYLVFGILYFI